MGYKTVYGLKVITSNIDQVGTILDSSIKAGANRINNIEFGLSDEKMEEAKIKVIKEAIKVAQVKANAMAEAGNLRIGKISQITESSYNIIPYNRALGADLKSSIVVPPEDVQISATVSVTYNI